MLCYSNNYNILINQYVMALAYVHDDDNYHHDNDDDDAVVLLRVSTIGTGSISKQSILPMPEAISIHTLLSCSWLSDSRKRTTATNYGHVPKNRLPVFS